MLKFNKSLSCNEKPFGYIESSVEVNMPNGKKYAVIAFGALDVNGHYSPEFGGVAIVHRNPDVYICYRYIPWDPAGRREEADRAVEWLSKNDVETNALAHHFDDEGYSIPYEKKRHYKEYIDFKRQQYKKYFESEEQKEDVEESTEENTEKKSNYHDGEELIDFD